MLTKILSIRPSPAIFALTLIIGTLAAGCRKAGITLPPSQADFLNDRSGAFFITSPGITDTISVGVTTVSGKDRTIPLIISSPTGATPGTQYSLASDSVTIPAGQVLGYIVVKGNYAFYNGTIRKDTLIFTFANDKNSGIAPSDFNDSFTLAMRGPCVEGEDFDPADFIGAYKNCIDSQAGAPSGVPYSITVSSVTSISPTSAMMIIQDLGYGTFYQTSTDTVNLDWSNPANLIATVPSQSYFVFTPFPPAAIVAGTGSFSSCHQTFVLNYDVIFEGYDYGVFTTTMAR